MLAALVLAAVLQENVVTLADPAQTYTLILPSSYDPAKKHPLLLIFDPRGRGTQAAEFFRAGAEEQGWIIVSSNGTRSDTDNEVNKRALRALIPDALDRYAVDKKRVYATGFSGTAMLSYAIGINTSLFAGVIGVGGRIVDGVPPGKFNFAHYGFAGDADFNNREMRLIDASIRDVPHRFDGFPGEHRWMTPELASDAIRWMEVIAMKEGRRPRDQAFIDDAYRRDVAVAAALPPRESLRRYEAIVRTFVDLHPMEEARAAVARLEKDPAVRREIREEAKWDAFEERFIREILGHLGTVVAKVHGEDAPLMRNRFLRELRVAEMKKRATHEGAEGRTARRILVMLHVQLAYQLPKQFEERGETALAEASRSAAEEIRK